MKNNLDKLGGAVLVQSLIFAYFYLAGAICTNEFDIRQWPTEWSVLYVFLSCVIGGAASYAFLTLKDEE
jgi:hypothetical protein